MLRARTYPTIGVEALRVGFFFQRLCQPLHLPRNPPFWQIVFERDVHPATDNKAEALGVGYFLQPSAVILAGPFPTHLAILLFPRLRGGRGAPVVANAGACRAEVNSRNSLRHLAIHYLTRNPPSARAHRPSFAVLCSYLHQAIARPLSVAGL